jgi:hypothetical protein
MHQSEWERLSVDERVEGVSVNALVVAPGVDYGDPGRKEASARQERARALVGRAACVERWAAEDEPAPRPYGR